MGEATEPDRHAEEEARAPVIRKRSDHGLGYLINPFDPDSADRDWKLHGWEWIVRLALGLDAPEPEWFDKPALMRYAATTPRLLDCLEHWNAAKPPRRQVRPFIYSWSPRKSSSPATRPASCTSRRSPGNAR
jgi:hypothetical protein